MDSNPTKTRQNPYYSSEGIELAKKLKAIYEKAELKILS